jgi:hypothetical protein
MKKYTQILKSKFRSGLKSKISKSVLKTLSYIAIAILVGVTAVYAGNLTPPGAPDKTMKSLSDLYELINTGANTPSTDFTTPATVTSTMHSLGDTYDLMATKISNIDTTKILTGTTIFGKAGTASAGPATLTWQTNPALNLCFSHNQYEIDNGCTVGSGFTQTPDTLTTLGAVEYCKYLNANGTTLANTEQNIWHLPTIQEYYSITDYTRFNSATAVTGFTGGSYYWSSTEYTGSLISAWRWYTYNGSTGSNDKDIQFPVRCAY